MLPLSVLAGKSVFIRLFAVCLSVSRQARVMGAGDGEWSGYGQDFPFG